MILLFRLAIRNVKRNFKPTLLNGMGISFSAIILLLTLSLSKGIETQIMSRNIRFDTGAVQINFSRKIASMQNKEAGDALLRTLTAYLDYHESVVGYAFRVSLANSISYFNDHAQMVDVTGLTQTEIPLLEEMFEITDGEVQFNNTKKIVISNALSELSGIHVGEVCTLMAQSVDGAVNLADFTVSGIFSYTSLRNKFSVYVDYDEAKSLYHTNLPSEILVLTDKLKQADAIKEGLLEQMGCTAERVGVVECGGTKISSFQDHAGMAKSLSAINKYAMLMVAFFLVQISFIGIWSMQTENINRRGREIGSLLSFGFGKRSVKVIFVLEILCVSLLFFAAGCVVTVFAIHLINLNNGVFLGESASYAFGSAIVNPVLTPEDLFTVFAITLIYPLIATLISLRVLNKSKIITLLNGNSH